MTATGKIPASAQGLPPDRRRRWGNWAGYAALLVCLGAAPFAIGSFWLGELTYVLILAIAGVGLMLLSGYTGLISLSHAAFIGIGAYTNVYLLNHGVSFALSLPAAGAVAGLAGVVLGLPMLRLAGLYLAIGTYAVGLIVEQVFINWEPVTNGFRGIAVPRPSVLGVQIADTVPLYFLVLVVLTASIVVSKNLLRTPTGRAFEAIRDSEVAAQSLGINVPISKTIAFGLSAVFAGLAGALLSHRIGYLAPDIFGVQFSIQMLVLIVVGGLGSMAGVIFGAIFVAATPQAISMAKDVLPPSIAQLPALEAGIMGLVLVLFTLYEPLGINGRWVKLRRWIANPGERKRSYVQRKSFQKTERLG